MPRGAARHSQVGYGEARRGTARVTDGDTEGFALSVILTDDRRPGPAWRGRAWTGGARLGKGYLR